MISKNTSIKYSKTLFFGKIVVNVRNSKRLELVIKDDYKETLKPESKLIFNGIHKSSTNCNCYTFKQNEVLTFKPILFRICCIRTE